MKQLYYTITTLVRGKSSAIIKVISLASGLIIGLLLFARVTFELGFDKHYADLEKLMRVKVWYTIGGEKRENATNYIYSTVPAAIMENFPAEVESATLVGREYGAVFYNGSHRRVINYANYADSLYFRTMGVEVLAGDPRELANIDVVFLSESLARQIYADDNPIGQVLMYNKNHPMTVRGVYKDVPENTTLRNDLLISFPTIHKVAGYQLGGWNKDDSFYGYVRLKTSDPSAVNARMDDMILKYIPDNGKNGFQTDFFLQPVKGEYAAHEQVHMMIWVMSLLAFVVLLIASLNYVLVSVSALPRRSKAIGIHKCSGASEGNIMSMFLVETAILVLLSLLIVAFLVFNFRDWIEDTVFASLSSLFSLQTIWVPCLIILLLFLFVGIIPGRIMARMPVSHVFRRYTERNTGWKKPLLFIQFTGTAFIAGLLMVILMQYNYVLNSPLGYQPRNVAVVTGVNVPDADFLKDELLRMPMVENVAMSSHSILSGWGGLPVQDASGKLIFTTRWNSFDTDYVPLMGIELSEGKNFDGPGQILINEKFVEAMKMQESPVGKPLPEIGREGIVVGIMKDFPVDDHYTPIRPVLVQSNMDYSNAIFCTVSVRVRDLNSETLAILNRKVEEMYPQNDIKFEPLEQDIRRQYEGTRRFRDAVVLATIVIILITLIGLIGYANDEIRRRSKEIAIRKINGGETNDVLRLLTGNILFTAIPAVLLGAAGAYIIGNIWIEQFSDKTNIPPVLFPLLAIVVLVLIILTVVFKSWRIANDNPVKSLVSE